ncbi:MAG: DUF4349 domain-containing protein [Solirubrobacteraceae bacterium]
MRWTEDESMEPEVTAALTAIDSTLAGEPADPEFAELAELALILRRERPEPDDGFTRELDGRVARRFVASEPAGPPKRGRLRSLLVPGSAAAALVAGLAVAVVIVGGGVGGFTSSSSSSSSSSSASVPSARSAPRANSALGRAASTTSASEAGASSSSSSASAPAPVPSPHRQIVQSAQLQLSASPGRIDDVSQQVFDVIGTEKGIVNSSNVSATGTASGTASFSLSVPSDKLGPTMTALSHLRDASVVSRTDTTSDITGQVGGAGERLAEARALRRSLLRQLAVATTTQAVNSFTLRLHGADASIASDLARLRGLQRQVAYSQIAVTIDTGNAPPPPTRRGGSFTLGHAAHDAGRVLVVVAGVMLIALAVLVPVGVVVALAAWGVVVIRRRRREHALDLV